MPSLRITHNDPLLEYVRQYPDSIAINSNSSTLQFKVSLPNQSAINEILSNSGNKYFYSCFKYTTNDKVLVEQHINYNAPAYYESLENSELFDITPEPFLFSIYQTTLLTESFLISNLKKENFLKAEGFPVPPFKNKQILSIDPSLSTGATAEYKSVYPNIVNFTFPAAIGTDNALLETLQDYKVYHGLIEFLNNSPTNIQTSIESSGDAEFEVFEITTLENNIPADFNDTEVTHIGNFEEIFYDQLFTQLDRSYFNQAIDNIASQKQLGFKQLMHDEMMVPNEVICYKIDKYNSQGQLIQTFYTPAVDGYRNFIDTQVLFNSTYTYDIHAFIAVYATEYSWEAMMLSNEVTITLQSENPSLRLFKVRLSTPEVQIKAFAPPKPDVSFLNRSDQEKTIRIYFEPNKHEFREGFIPIEDGEEETQMSANVDSSGKMIFKQSNQAISYEIYKLNKKPTSYDDFKNNIYATVPNTTLSNSELYEMYLTPNRKFYFMFRSKNEFNLLSNPSAIYELELIKDSDETKIVSKIITMKDTEPKSIRTFGRFLKIYPAFEQITVNQFTELTTLEPSLTGTENYNYYIGDSESPIWGRKFKLRVRSRNTGKVVDLNVDFVLNKIESEEDFNV